MHEFLQYRVRHVMTTTPETIEPSASLAHAEAIFDQHDFNALPVVEPDGTLVGIFSKLDLLAAFTFTPASIIPRYEEVMRSQIAERMTREPATVSPDLPLTRLLQKLVETRNKSFPVLDGTRLVGVVAREDVLRALRRSAAGELPQEHPGSGS
jgi:CBS domain-containing protein